MLRRLSIGFAAGSIGAAALVCLPRRLVGSYRLPVHKPPPCRFIFLSGALLGFGGAARISAGPPLDGPTHAPRPHDFHCAAAPCLFFHRSSRTPPPVPGFRAAPRRAAATWQVAARQISSLPLRRPTSARFANSAYAGRR